MGKMDKAYKLINFFFGEYRNRSNTVKDKTGIFKIMMRKLLRDGKVYRGSKRWGKTAREHY